MIKCHSFRYHYLFWWCRYWFVICCNGDVDLWNSEKPNGHRYLISSFIIITIIIMLTVVMLLCKLRGAIDEFPMFDSPDDW